jgi:predicted acyl esterase
MSKKPGIDRAAKLALCILLACAQAVAAELLEKSEVMIPMRDGVKLHTVIFTPKDRIGPLRSVSPPASSS